MILKGAEEKPAEGMVESLEDSAPEVQASISVCRVSVTGLVSTEQNDE
jgi:hypothetical protein